MQISDTEYVKYLQTSLNLKAEEKKVKELEEKLLVEQKLRRMKIEECEERLLSSDVKMKIQELEIEQLKAKMMQMNMHIKELSEENDRLRKEKMPSVHVCVATKKPARGRGRGQHRRGRRGLRPASRED